jgi:hypothetical protein
MERWTRGSKGGPSLRKEGKQVARGLKPVRDDKSRDLLNVDESRSFDYASARPAKNAGRKEQADAPLRVTISKAGRLSSEV